jgi:hypothetical protein
MEKISYQYDPIQNQLTISVNGSPRGGFIGASAERELRRVLDSGAEITITDMTNLVKSAKVRRLRALWIRLGIDDHREVILDQYNVSSTADLSLEELEELITRFSAEVKSDTSESVRKLRSDILKQLNTLGIYAQPGNWKAVNDYLMQDKIAGKLLFEMSEQQLLTLRRKLHSIVTKEAKK